MVVHCRNSLVRIYIVHVYTWMERGTVRVKSLAQEHNTMSPTTINYLEMRVLTMRSLCLYDPLPCWLIIIDRQKITYMYPLPIRNWKRLGKVLKCWRTWRITLNTFQNAKHCIPQVQRILQYWNSGQKLLKYCKKNCLFNTTVPQNPMSHS